MTTTTSLTRSKRVPRTKGEWREVFTRFEQSDQTIEQFCTQQGLALSTFNRWRHKLRTQCHKAIQGSPEAVFVELTTSDAPPTVLPPAWDVELELGTGIFLRLRQSPC